MSRPPFEGILLLVKYSLNENWVISRVHRLFGRSHIEIHPIDLESNKLVLLDYEHWFSQDYLTDVRLEELEKSMTVDQAVAIRHLYESI